MKAPNLSNLRKYLDALCSSMVESRSIVALRAGGEELKAGDHSRRDELLAKVAAGEYVEIEIDLLAFEQKPGLFNGKFVRFADPAMLALGKSGVGMPLLRDHEQGNVQARAGTVVASKAEDLGGGHWRLIQTAAVTAAWAVELVLRGLIDRFSIGWRATAPVLCSACNKPVFSACYHWAGDRLREQVVDGQKRLVRDALGDVVVEFIFTAARLVETSAVSVPAVPSAQIEAVRAAVLADLGVSSDPDDGAQESCMSLKLALVPILCLAATASDDEVTAAVNSQHLELEALKAQHKVLTAKNAELAAQLAATEATAKKSAEDAFIESAIKSRKLAAGSDFEAKLRAFYAVSPDGAKGLVASMPEVTQVGGEKLRDLTEVKDGGAGAGAKVIVLSEHQKAHAKELGIEEAEYVRLAAAGGI